MPTVFVVDDDLQVRDALRRILRQAGSDRFTLVGEAGSIADARAAFDALTGTPIDVLLLDLGLPDGEGTEVLKDLSRRETKPVLAIVLTVFEDDTHLFAALRAGAVGYLLKDDLHARLIAGLDDLIAGGSPMSPSIARRVLAAFAPAPKLPSEKALTPREIEVAELLASGATYDEIGSALSVSANTIRTYIRSIYGKFQVSTRTEAVLEAMRRGIVERR
ncbi:MAG: response regulator transcription factor [Polyangiales bacterium]